MSGAGRSGSGTVNHDAPSSASASSDGSVSRSNRRRRLTLQRVRAVDTVGGIQVVGREVNDDQMFQRHWVFTRVGAEQKLRWRERHPVPNVVAPLARRSRPES